MLFKSKPKSDSTPASATKTVVLVGHCMPDKFMLKNTIGRFVPNAAIEAANNEKTLAPHLNAETVLLVNRVLDGNFETGSGIELIARVTKGDDAPSAILISNFEESQIEAVAAGALRGFGKSDLYTEETGAILRDATAL